MYITIRFDHQSCKIIIGSWTKEGINLQLTNQTINKSFSKDAIDLSAFESNVEYDLISVNAQLIQKKSNYSLKTFEEIVFNIKLRRKVLFYIVYLILPCMIINALSIAVFYLPSKSKEKVRIGAFFFFIYLQIYKF